MKNQIKIGELELPINYYDLSENEKKMICESLIDALLKYLEKNFNRNLDKIMVLNAIIDSSILTNEEEENYEVCSVLTDIKKMLNEPTN